VADSLIVPVYILNVPQIGDLFSNGRRKGVLVLEVCGQVFCDDHCKIVWIFSQGEEVFTLWKMRGSPPIRLAIPKMNMSTAREEKKKEFH
jgi:hypothetical protein